MKIGTVVYYTSGRLGDGMHYPLLDGRYGRIKGKIIEIQHDRCRCRVDFGGIESWLGLIDVVPTGSIAVSYKRYIVMMQVALADKPWPVGHPKVNDRVVYVSGRYGNSNSNPLFPVRSEPWIDAVGTLQSVNDPNFNYRCRVQWDTGTNNTYLLGDLRTATDPVLETICKEMTDWKTKNNQFAGVFKSSPAPILTLPEDRIKGIFNV